VGQHHFDTFAGRRIVFNEKDAQINFSAVILSLSLNLTKIG